MKISDTKYEFDIFSDILKKKKQIEDSLISNKDDFNIENKRFEDQTEEEI